MDKYKHRVSFRLEKRKDKEGKYATELPINADITFGGKRIWYYTGYKIAPSKWDEKAQRVKRNNFNSDNISSTDINLRLGKIEAAVDTAFGQLELLDEAVTPATVREELKRVLNEEKGTRLTIHQTYQLLIDEREKEIKESLSTAQWTVSTLKKHKTMLRHLTDFRGGLYFEDVNDDLLAKFELFLVGKGLANGYVSKSMRDILTFLNWATRKGYNKSTAYKTYQPRFRDETKSDSTVNLFALTEEELLAIMTFPTHRSAIDRARDVFLFSCFTGLRFSDVMNLRWSNIKGDIIDITAKKTSHRQRFALATEALRIIAKYPKSPDETDPCVFPQISNQKYNAHLKEVGKLAGMTGDWITEKQSGREKTREVRPKYELLTSHVARRTFVTMCLRKGMSPEDIRAVTGHTTADMMMKYVKFDDESKREKMSILNANRQQECETVFDYGVSTEERMKLGIPEQSAYFELFEGDTSSVTAHLALLFHLRKDFDRRATYMKRLPNNKFNEVIEVIIGMEIS